MQSLIRHGIELDINGYRNLRKKSSSAMNQQDQSTEQIWRERFGSHQEYTRKSVVKTSYPRGNSDPKLFKKW